MLLVEARLTSSPSQVSPPGISVDARLPHAVPGADVVALPVLPPGEPGGSPLLGPGADRLGELLGSDLLGVLESARATGRAGEVTSLPVPAGVPGAPDRQLP